MIAFLNGRVAARDERSLTLDVHGVGFRVFVLPKEREAHQIDEQITLLTFLYVRDEMMELYGFSRPTEERMFQQLLSVSGVGPKMALAVMSSADVDDLQEAIDKGEPSVLTGVSGVGTKTAQRIIIDLRGKLNLNADGDSAVSEIIDALTHLGYSSREAREAAAKTTPSDSAEDRIKAALKYLGR